MIFNLNQCMCCILGVPVRVPAFGYGMDVEYGRCFSGVMMRAEYEDVFKGRRRGGHAM